MKFSHNKKRNTAFIYEVLVVELSKASMAAESEKKNKLVTLLKELFSKGRILKRDLDIYKSFDDVSDLGEDMISKLIQEANLQYTRLNRKKVFDQQTLLIDNINKNFGVSVWSNFVRDYKKLATVNQALNKTQSPKKQILIEKKLLGLLTTKRQEKEQFPNVNNLAVKTFIKKFNEEYNKTLREEQKLLLEKYIMSSSSGEMEFKIHFYGEVDRLKAALKDRLNESKSSDKIQKIINRMDNYNTRELDKSLIAEVMKIQSLVSEIS